MEVLVVLTILALLTTVAVTSSDVFLSQGRYEATTRTLTDIQEAVLGPPNARQADGTLISTGFIADVGRSLLSTSADPTLALSELWALPSGMAPFSLIQSSNDTDVVVPCGWRGPYLRLPVGQSNVRDGWGNAMNLFTDLTGDPAAVGNPILAVSSSGGDTSPYNAPLEVNLAPSQIAVGGNVYVLDSNGNPGNPSSASAIQVWIYGPNPNTGLLLETQCNTTAAANGVVSYSIPTGVYVYAPGFLRAYLGDRSTLPPVRRMRHRAVPTKRRNQPKYPMNRPIHTILLITPDQLVRADLNPRRLPRVRGVYAGPRPAVDDFPLLVETALRLGGRRQGSVWVLSTDFWTQTLALPAQTTAGVKNDELGRALGFEAEPFSGLSALETIVGYVPQPGHGAERFFWLTQVPRTLLEQVEYVVERAGGRLAGLGHPGGVPHVLCRPAEPPETAVGRKSWSPGFGRRAKKKPPKGGTPAGENTIRKGTGTFFGLRAFDAARQSDGPKNEPVPGGL